MMSGVGGVTELLFRLCLKRRLMEELWCVMQYFLYRDSLQLGSGLAVPGSGY